MKVYDIFFGKGTGYWAGWRDQLYLNVKTDISNLVIGM